MLIMWPCDDTFAYLCGFPRKGHATKQMTVSDAHDSYKTSILICKLSL